MQVRTLARFPGYRFRSSGTILGQKGLPSRRGVKTRPETHCRSVRLVDRDGQVQEVLAADLICEAFRGPRPPGASVRFTDGNEYNWSAGNLSWDTEPAPPPAPPRRRRRSRLDSETRDMILHFDREDIDPDEIAALVWVDRRTVEVALADEDEPEDEPDTDMANTPCEAFGKVSP